jgi:hypothetical protein
VVVTTDNLRQERWLQSGTSYLSSHENRVHFGLPESAVTAEVDVRWPSGETQRWEVSEPGRRFAVVQGEPALRPE